MVQDPAIKVRQGALEYNAYLIKNLLARLVNEEIDESEYQTCLDVLYLNLKKLSYSADYSLKLHQLNSSTKKQIDFIINEQDQVDNETKKLRKSLTEEMEEIANNDLILYIS